MAGKIVADTIETGAGADISTSYVVEGSVKVWVNFNGTGTPAINDSNNVASLTDDGTGKYRVNTSSAFSSVNHSSTGTNIGDNTTGNRASVTIAAAVQTSTSSAIPFVVYAQSISNYLDCTDVNIHTLGDLA